LKFLLFWNYWTELVDGKLLIVSVGYSVRYCSVLVEMLPVVHQNVRSAEEVREVLCCSL